MNTGENGGILSKFQERLRKIRISRAIKKKKNQDFIDEKVSEIRKTVGKSNNSIKIGYVKQSVGVTNVKEMKNKSLPTVDNVKKNNKYKVQKRLLKGKFYENEKKYLEDRINKTNNINKKDEVIAEKNDLNKTQRKGYVYKKRAFSEIINKNKLNEDEKKTIANDFGSEIILKIKNSFLEKLDELDVLESELFFIKDELDNELQLKKVKEVRKKIDDLIKQLNELIEQYNLYNSYYYIDNVVGIDDNIIVDDIISYRDLLDSFQDEKKFVNEYKVLDEFRRLYSNLKKVKNETDELVKVNEEKIEKYDIRDKKFDKIKLTVVKMDNFNKDCDYEIQKQNKYFSDLMKKINKIDSHKYSTYKLNGLNDLMVMSLRYIGYMMISPLSGLIPSIGINAIATRRMIGNIYRNMSYEKVEHVYYDTINYDSELSHHLCDVNYVDSILEDTLKDVSRLKEDFMRIYDSNIPGYDTTLKNILKIEEKVIHNQNKIDIVRKKLKVSKKINANKLIKVKTLNNN